MRERPFTLTTKGAVRSTACASPSDSAVRLLLIEMPPGFRMRYDEPGHIGRLVRRDPENRAGRRRGVATPSRLPLLLRRRGLRARLSAALPCAWRDRRR